MTRQVDELFSYIFIWHALADACPKCQALDGREYRGQDVFAPELIDAEFGPIWDLEQDHSLAHGREEYNCRCHLECKAFVNLNEWEPYVQLQEHLSGVHAETFMRRGKMVTVHRETRTGRFVTG